MTDLSDVILDAHGAGKAPSEHWDVCGPRHGRKHGRDLTQGAPLPHGGHGRKLSRVERLLQRIGAQTVGQQDYDRRRHVAPNLHVAFPR